MGDNGRPTPDPDHAWKALSLVNDWIKHADAKMAVTLAAAATIALSLFNLAEGEEGPGTWFMGFAGVTAGALVATVLCAFRALVPRVTLVGRKEPEALDNLLFYRHTARGYEKRKAAYALALAELTMDEQTLTRHIAEQVHVNSTVADRKYKWADRALRALSAAVCFLVATATIAVWAHLTPTHASGQDQPAQPVPSNMASTR